MLKEYVIKAIAPSDREYFIVIEPDGYGSIVKTLELASTFHYEGKSKPSAFNIIPEGCTFSYDMKDDIKEGWTYEAKEVKRTIEIVEG